MKMSFNATAIRKAATTALDRIRAGRFGLAMQKLRSAVVSRFPRLGIPSLTTRIMLLQFAWTLIIYVLVITAIWFATNLVIQSNVRNQGKDWIAKLDEMGMPIYATNKPARLKQIFTSLRNFPEIAEAAYLDDTGKIITEYTRNDKQDLDFAPLTDENINNLERTDVDEKPTQYEFGQKSQMRVSAPIWIKSISKDGMIDFSLDKTSKEKIRTIGFIQVVLDYSKAMDDLNQNIIRASMLIAAMMLGAAFVMRYMVRRALRPLAELEEPLTRLANGETDVQVNTSGDREIARIGIALNTTISALKERDETLRQMAVHDALTGLANRAYFVDRLDQELKRIARGGDSAALFFFDLDRFKNINDTYGHAAGDRLLIQVTKQLSQRIRENDLFARYGGDEFTLLAYDVDIEQARELAESFIALMHDFVFYEAGETIKIYFSIGVTLIDNGHLTVQECLNEADSAVHQAKSSGRNCYRVFERDMLETPGGTDTGWHERLQDMLDKRQAILYYQPMAGLKDQQEKIQEVLLRLPDVDQQVISPNAFMPAAERFGLMGDFDRLVIEKSSEELAGMNDPQAVFSLNLCEQFFAKEDIPEFLEQAIEAHKLDPGRFIFELSQSYVARNMDMLQPIIAQLVERGYRVAIDDFGADAGSFNFIRNFPAHYLKIDGSLIEHLATDNIAKVSVRAIAEVAAELNMMTIAKNVADEGSLVLLRKLGIDYAQGNYISAPAPQLFNVVFSARRPHIRKSEGSTPKPVKAGNKAVA
jgi:diguanylate cyclase (GGDEF)-like protein